jgi:hypothetical protein
MIHDAKDQTEADNDKSQPQINLILESARSNESGKKIHRYFTIKINELV